MTAAPRRRTILEKAGQRGYDGADMAEIEVFVLMILVSFLVCCLPSVALFVYLRQRVRPDAEFRKLCGKTLWHGVLSSLLVVLLSAVLTILLSLTDLKERSIVLYQLLYTCVAIALSEELVKTWTGLRRIRRSPTPLSWLDITALMTVAALGFGMAESLVYSLNTGLGLMIVRGVCIPHGGYGFLVGYFYGRSLESGKRSIRWLGLALAWLLHGLYDFSLSDNVPDDGLLAFIAVTLAVLDVVLVVLLIVFTERSKRRGLHTAPILLPAETEKQEA